MKSRLGEILRRNDISRSELAQEMGVSVPTVDNWCSRRYHIALDQLQQLAEVLRNAGIGDAEVTRLVREELAAQGLKVKSLELRDGAGENAASPAPDPKKVLVIAWNMSRNSFYGELGPMCLDSVERLGCEAILVDCCGRHHLKRQYLAQASAMGVDGVVLAVVPGERPDPESDIGNSVTPLTSQGIPVVFVRPWAEDPQLPSGTAGIGWDPRVAVQRSVGILKREGHTRIGGIFVNESNTYRSMATQMPMALESHGLTSHPSQLMFLTPEGDAAPDEMTYLLAENTALLASPAALEPLMGACYGNSLRWPDDISIITFGREHRIPQLGPRPFSYVELPFGYVSHRAARLIVELMAGEVPEPQITVLGEDLMPLRNLTRGSVGPCRVSRAGAAGNGLGWNSVPKEPETAHSQA